MSAPVRYCWSGEAMVPTIGFERIAKQQFTTGHTYLLEESSTRSQQSHSHFFAVVKTVYDNLPEDIDSMWKDAEELRAWALIEAGYSNVAEETFPTKEEAMRAAHFMMRASAAKGIYARVELKGRKVIWRTARSQARKAMSGREFADCKERVFQVLGKLIGVPVEELKREAA
jgi:hypothetical protein